MQRTVAEFKDEISGLLTGTNLDNVNNLDGAIARAARVLAQNVDIPDATGRAQYSVYDRVFDYPAPVSIFGGSLSDFRPQGVSRSPWEDVYKQPIKLFDQTKCYIPGGVAVTFEYNLGIPFMRVAGTRAKSSVMLDAMNDDTDWIEGGTASGLTVDSTFYYQSPASLRYQLTGAGTGYLEKTLTNAIDLSTYEDVGVVFLAIETASAANLSSMEIRIGSSSANFNNVTQTEGFLGAWQSDEFLLVAFDLAAASQTGTPDFSAIDYIRVSSTTAGTLTNFRVGGLFIALPSPYTLLYQTAAIFNSNGTLSNEISSDNDIIILNDAAYTLFEYEACIAILEEIAGGTSGNAGTSFKDKLHSQHARNGTITQMGLYDLYRADNPSAEIREVGNWYEEREF